MQLGRKRKASRNWELGYLEPYKDGQGFGSMGVHGSARGAAAGPGAAEPINAQYNFCESSDRKL